MIPFLHLGPLSIPTFGLMVAIAMLVSAYVLQADFNRRRSQLQSISARNEKDEGFLIIGVAGLAGLIGARLYHVLESPHDFFADPWPQLISRYGFAWFGGFLGGFIALVLLARRSKIPRSRVSGYLFARGLRRLRHRTHRLLALRRWRLRHSDVASLGHEFSEWPCPHHGNLRPAGLAGKLPRASHSALRILHLARHCRISLAHGHEIPPRPQSQRRNFLQLSDSHRHRPLSRSK